MRITFFTNDVTGGWLPQDLENFLGGNEEAIVLLSKGLVREGHEVEVFTSLREQKEFEFLGVKWKHRGLFDFNKQYDVLITMKDSLPWLRAVGARVKLHWCKDIEKEWSFGRLSQIDKFITLGTYHESRIPWLPDKKTIIPYGFEVSKYAKANKKDKQKAFLYSTSPDRGLETLLRDWALISRNFPGYRLLVTYGFHNFDKFGGNPEWKNYISNLMNQPGVFSTGTLKQKDMTKLFGLVEYWVHPLNHPDSDLAGFSAMKAFTAGAKIVIPDTKNGFQDSVMSFLPYHSFKEGNPTVFSNENYKNYPTSYDRIIPQYWLPLFKGA